VLPACGINGHRSRRFFCFYRKFLAKVQCYVDETGQETHAPFFLVSVVIVEEDREHLENVLERIERISRKGTRKWNKAQDKRRTKYIELVFQEKRFRGKFYYVVDETKEDYVQATILKRPSWERLRQSRRMLRVNMRRG